MPATERSLCPRVCPGRDLYQWAIIQKKILLGIEVEERGLLEKKVLVCSPSLLLRGEVWVLPQNPRACFPPWSWCLVLDPPESSQRGHPPEPTTLCGSGRAHRQCSSWRVENQGANPEDGDRCVSGRNGGGFAEGYGCPRRGKRARGQGQVGECTAHQQRLLSPS